MAKANLLRTTSPRSPKPPNKARPVAEVNPTCRDDRILAAQHRKRLRVENLLRVFREPRLSH